MTPRTRAERTRTDLSPDGRLPISCSPLEHERRRLLSYTSRQSVAAGQIVVATDHPGLARLDRCHATGVAWVDMIGVIGAAGRSAAARLIFSVTTRQNRGTSWASRVHPGEPGPDPSVSTDAPQPRGRRAQKEQDEAMLHPSFVTAPRWSRADRERCCCCSRRGQVHRRRACGARCDGPGHVRFTLGRIGADERRRYHVQAR